MKTRLTSPGRPLASTLKIREDHLYRISADEFLEHGYGAASMSRIARAAHVSTKTLYARYANKEDLFISIVNRMTAASKADHQELMNNLSKDPEEVLVEVAMRHARHWTSSQEIGLYKMIITENQRFPELIKTYLNMVDQYRVFSTGYFGQQMKRGVLKIDDIELAVDHFSMLTSVYIRDIAIIGKKLDADEVLNKVKAGVVVFLKSYRA